MATLSFKDVGTLKVAGQTYQERNTSSIPIGVKTPLELDYNSSSLFAMHFSLKNQLADNLRNLVQTNWGERLGLYMYGANLLPLVTEFSHREDFDNEAMIRINTAVQKWMPFVQLVDYESNPEYESGEFIGNVRLSITYSVPILNEENNKIEVYLAVQ